MNLGEKLSIYLNKHYSYHKIKTANTNDISELTFKYLESLEIKIYQQPSIALRSAKTEMNEIYNHYSRLIEELQIYFKETNLIINGRNKIPKEELQQINKLEVQINALKEFIYNIEDAFYYISNFLLKHFEELENDEAFLEKYSIFIRTKQLNKKVEYKEFEIVDERLKENNFFSEYILKGIEALSEKPIKFEKEDDYRTHFYHSFSMLKGAYVTAEAISRQGRTDLMVKCKFWTKIIEFKIWGRNNHQEVIEQLNDYMTDFQQYGYIIIANHNKKKRIIKEYLNIIRSSEMNLIGEIKELTYKDTPYKYFVSTHKFKEERKIITHYIYNLHQ